MTDFNQIADALDSGPLLPLGLDPHAYGEFIDALRAAKTADDLSPENATLLAQVEAMTKETSPWQVRPVPGAVEPDDGYGTKPPPLGWYSDVDWTDAILDGPGPEYANGKPLILPDPATRAAKPDS